MTLLPEVRRQLGEAAERQASSQTARGRPSSVGVRRLRRRPSISFAHLGLATSVVVVAVVAAAFLGRGGSTPAGSRTASVVRVVFRAHPTPQTPLLTQSAMARAVVMMRQRLGSSFHDFSVTRSPDLGLTVVVRHAAAGARTRILALSRSAQLYFYDWEANALAANGRSVAGQLVAGNQNATLISQGAASSSPGSSGAGSMSLYAAVKLASEQKNPPIGSFNSRLGPLYYRFGASGSAACAQAGKFYGFIPVAGQRCLLSGPEPTVHDLNLGLPPGISTSGQVLSVPQGIVVLQAVPESFAHPLTFTDPGSQFFVLTDHLALLGSDITNPKQGTDAAGSPDVTFGFNPGGNRQFEMVTRQIAKRGALRSGPGQQLNQHFSVALDTQLLTVPSIDFKQYPDGIAAAGGADITGSFTIRSARDLATQLRSGPLPVQLTPTS